MKTLVILSLVFFLGLTVQAQEVTELEEARINYSPLLAAVSADLENFSYAVNENVAGEFVKDPITFLKKNFDVHSFIEAVNNQDYDTYVITLTSSKGFLEANYSKEGELLSSVQKFKNILLPYSIRQDLVADHEGWSMVKNRFIASGNGDEIDRAVYKIKMKKDNKTRNLKIDASGLKASVVALNY